jgi:hypothetical protein
MDLGALIEGTPYTRCPCLTDESVHYHAGQLFIMSILYAEQWRMRTLKLLSPRTVTWNALGGDDLEWSMAAGLPRTWRFPFTGYLAVNPKETAAALKSCAVRYETRKAAWCPVRNRHAWEARNDIRRRG